MCLWARRLATEGETSLRNAEIRPRHLLHGTPDGGPRLAYSTNSPRTAACAPMLLGRVLLEAMCDDLPDAQARLEQFDARAAVRGLFVE